MSKPDKHVSKEDDRDVIRLSIAEWRARIQLERAETFERCARMIAICQNPKAYAQIERDAWERFYRRVRPFEIEVEVMTQALAVEIDLESPVPIIMPKDEQ